MLSARAYSFRMKSRLAISLGWIAGYVNVVSFLTCGTMTSHVTGNATLALLHNVDGHRQLAGYAAFAVGAFFAGCLVSALLTETARRRGWRSKYVAPIAIEGLLLGALSIALSRWGVRHTEYDETWWSLVGLAGAAMGVQNAVVSRISGSVVRTTHLTGVVTDLAIEGVQFVHWTFDRVRGIRRGRVGRLLRIARRQPEALRLLLLVSIFGSFLFGAAVGTFLFLWSPPLSMLPPVVFLGWILIVDVRSPIADVRELDALSDSGLSAAGLVRDLLPPDVGIFRLHCAGKRRSHQAPDFVVWVERLPTSKRVLVLNLSPLIHLDEDASQNLREGAELLRRSGRRLVIGGVTPPQYQALERHGVLRGISSDDVWPDLEFALARAASLAAGRDDGGRTHG